MIQLWVEEAVDIFMSNKDISLIIMDVMMPKLDGYQASAEIRKMSNVPIIMLTAKSNEIDELKGFEIGVDEYIRWNKDGYSCSSGVCG